MPSTRPPRPAPRTLRSRSTTDISLLLLVSLTSTLGTVLALQALSYIPRFDASGSVFGRWDAVHFFSVSESGYQTEQQGAFQPGWHLLLRLASRISSFIRGVSPWNVAWLEDTGVAELGREGTGIRDVELGGLVLNAGFKGLAAVGLYGLVKELVGRRAGLAAGLLYAYPPSPASALTYTEPAYAAAYFGGLLALRKRRWVAAAACFAAATSLRATGVFTAAILGWTLLFAPSSDSAVTTSPTSPPTTTSNLSSDLTPPKGVSFQTYLSDALSHPLRSLLRIFFALPLILLIASPFLAFNYALYSVLCPGREWCTNPLPLAYTAIQRQYWNIGLLNYWTPAQIPNLLLAVPVLAPTLAGAWSYFSGRALELHSSRHHHSSSSSSPSSTGTVSAASTRGNGREAEKQKQSAEGNKEEETVEHGPLPDALYAHSVFLALTLIFGSHTQIALRLALTEPVLWITLAINPKMRRGWVWWCFPWAALSLGLWAGHYPPA